MKGEAGMVTGVPHAPTDNKQHIEDSFN